MPPQTGWDDSEITIGNIYDRPQLTQAQRMAIARQHWAQQIQLMQYLDRHSENQYRNANMQSQAEDRQEHRAEERQRFDLEKVKFYHEQQKEAIQAYQAQVKARRQAEKDKQTAILNTLKAISNHQGGAAQSEDYKKLKSRQYILGTALDWAGKLPPGTQGGDIENRIRDQAPPLAKEIDARGDMPQIVVAIQKIQGGEHDKYQKDYDTTKNILMTADGLATKQPQERQQILAQYEATITNMDNAVGNPQEQAQFVQNYLRQYGMPVPQGPQPTRQTEGGPVSRTPQLHPAGYIKTSDGKSLAVPTYGADRAEVQRLNQYNDSKATTKAKTNSTESFRQSVQDWSDDDMLMKDEGIKAKIPTSTREQLANKLNTMMNGEPANKLPEAKIQTPTMTEDGKPWSEETPDRLSELSKLPEKIRARLKAKTPFMAPRGGTPPFMPPQIPQPTTPQAPQPSNQRQAAPQGGTPFMPSSPSWWTQVMQKALDSTTPPPTDTTGWLDAMGNGR